MPSPTNYSPSETRLLALLTTEPKSTEDLARIYWQRRQKPFHARIVITNLVRSLVKKTSRAETRVRKSRPSGPNAMEVWLEKSRTS